MRLWQKIVAAFALPKQGPNTFIYGPIVDETIAKNQLANSTHAILMTIESVLEKSFGTHGGHTKHPPHNPLQ